MIATETARGLAQEAVRHGQVVDRERFTETREGWYFPYEVGAGLIGSSGVIVHKRTGRALVLGSAFSVERDLRAFDDGFQFELYDLVILEVMDRQMTLKTLATVGPTVTTPEYESGTVWRIPRRLSRGDIETRLAKLPVVFPEVRLYFCIEALQEAKQNGYFRFEALECKMNRPD
jgi:hypothetical protein